MQLAKKYLTIFGDHKREGEKKRENTLIRVEKCLLFATRTSM